MANIDDFLKLDIRVGKVVKVENFTEARKPSYKQIKMPQLVGGCINLTHVRPGLARLEE